jgi:hypothetical protein
MELAVFGNSSGGAATTIVKTSVISTSSSVGVCAFNSLLLNSKTFGSCIVVAGCRVFGASSAGMDGTGVLFTLASSNAFGFG